MKAVFFRRHGGSEVLEYGDLPAARPADGEVLVRVRAVSVNRSLDNAIRAGRGQFKVPFPHVLGIDPAGEVAEAAAGVEGWRSGDRVVVIPNLWCGVCEPCRDGFQNACLNGTFIGVQRHGGYAEYVTAPASNLLRIPESLSYVEASAMIAMHPIAWHLLMNRARLRAGESVLIMAAGGSLGNAGSQIAKLAGAEVIAAAGADWKLDRARELFGVDHVVNYSRGGLAEQVRKLTGGRGVDVVFENISSPELWPESTGSLAVRGRLVTCGTHGGGEVPLNVAYFYRRHLSLLTSAGATLEDIDAVWRLATLGKLRPHIYRVLPLDQAAAAQDLVDSRDVFGRIVLEVG